MKLPLDFPEKVFIAAWNQLVSERDPYESELRQIIDDCDLLQRYRAMKLIRLIDEVGIIESMPYELMPYELMPYELMLKVLDHIKVEKAGCDHNFNVFLVSALQTMTHKIHLGK